MSEPPEVLYPAWTSEEFGKWFGNCEESILMVPKLNVPFYFEARPDGERHAHYGRFLQLEPNRLVEMTWVNEVATKGAETVVRVELEPSGEGTLLKLSHRGFRDEQSRDGHAEAWPHVLDHLEAVYHP